MSFQPSLHLLNWDFVLSVSIKENEAAADVTAFVSYSACRWWWKRRLSSAWRHTLDWTSKICAVHVGTYTCILHILPWAEDIKPRPWESVHHCSVRRKNWRLTWRQLRISVEILVHEGAREPTATTCFLNHLFMHLLDNRRPQGCKHRGVKRRVAVAPPIAVKEHSRVHLLPRSCKLFLIKGSWCSASCRVIYIAASACAYRALTAAQIQLKTM